MINKSKLKILIILIVLGLIGGLGGAIALGLAQGIGGRATLSDDLAVRQIAGSYLQAWQDSDTDKMYAYLSNTDKAQVTMSEYKRHFEAFPFAPLHFKLSTVKLSGEDRALIKVRITWPDPDDERFMENEEQLVLIKEESVWRISEAESLN